MRHRALRDEVIAVARAMSDRGLSPGTSGNVSARVPGGMLITPSAVPYPQLEPEGLALVGLDGGVLEKGGRPSTEWRLHAHLFQHRPEVGAILHAHAPFCTALSCLRRDIPAFHYMVAMAGGESIRCAPYATFGTEELAELASSALEGRTACLLANHGMVALAASPTAALDLALEVEALAATYWRALQVGEPVLLTPQEMAAVEGRMRSYRDPGA